MYLEQNLGSAGSVEAPGLAEGRELQVIAEFMILLAFELQAELMHQLVDPHSTRPLARYSFALARGLSDTHPRPPADAGRPSITPG